MLFNKNFLGLEDRYCLIEKFLCRHTYECANIDVCSYPNLSKELIAEERPLLQPMGNSRLQTCVISIQSYVTMK
jgi:hypothetical protein